ncbi:glycoprotein Xg isoform X2 [Saccopteryx bilineata]|uniref:glycoprotein Xg isoform X2 n=1 Tax=Saccopteryx bilineata TaxID=59482 RepID=UPI00338F1B95
MCACAEDDATPCLQRSSPRPCRWTCGRYRGKFSVFCGSPNSNQPVTKVQREYRRVYNEAPPHRNHMTRWDKQLKETGSLVEEPRSGQGDFDLADALDDPEPTKKPGSDIYPRPKPPAPRPQPGSPDSGNIYPKPKPPYRPQPGYPDGGTGDIYPRPKPPAPRPQPGSHDSGGYYGDGGDGGGGYQPRPRPPAGGGGGGGGYQPGYDGYGNSHGGDSYNTYGDPHGNTVAKIVSPIVSVVVVTLVGAAAGYFQRNRRRNCFRTSAPENV